MSNILQKLAILELNILEKAQRQYLIFVSVICKIIILEISFRLASNSAYEFQYFKMLPNILVENARYNCEIF